MISALMFWLTVCPEQWTARTGSFPTHSPASELRRHFTPSLMPPRQTHTDCTMAIRAWIWTALTRCAWWKNFNEEINHKSPPTRTSLSSLWPSSTRQTGKSLSMEFTSSSWNAFPTTWKTSRAGKILFVTISR